MFCKNCGKEIKDTEKFCSYCGTPVDVHEDNINRQENIRRKNVYTDNFNTVVPPKKSKSKLKKVIIAIIAVLVALVFLLYGYLEMILQDRIQQVQYKIQTTKL